MIHLALSVVLSFLRIPQALLACYALRNLGLVGVLTLGQIYNVALLWALFEITVSDYWRDS